jgi:hypothetical protein
MEMPTIEEYRRLYAAAATFKEAAPWTWMTEEELFGVRNPETGEVGYASIMGQLGEHLALGLYLGSQGLDDFLRMIRGDEHENPSFLLETHQLQASFEDRDALYPEDREVMKALGLKFRGRQAWPAFRSFMPGYLPWLVTSAEARFLTVALEQVVEVTGRLAKNRTLLNPPREGHVLVRSLTVSGWADEWFLPPAPPERILPPVDATRLAALRQKLPSSRHNLQVDIFPLPGSFKDKDDPRPYLAYNMLVVDAASTFILATEVLSPKPTLDALWDQAPEKLLGVLIRFGSLPKQITVRRPWFRRLLGATVTGLGSQIKLAHRLPALDEVRANFEQVLRR